MVLVLGKIRYEPQGRKTNDKHMFQGDRKMLLERPPKYIILKWGHLSVRGNGKNYFLNVTLLFYSSLPSSFKGKVESKYFHAFCCFEIILVFTHYMQPTPIPICDFYPPNTNIPTTMNHPSTHQNNPPHTGLSPTITTAHHTDNLFLDSQPRLSSLVNFWSHLIKTDSKGSIILTCDPEFMSYWKQPPIPKTFYLYMDIKFW